jgi:glutamyl-tRNA synthetase
VPLVLGADGERLAKRHGAIAIAELRDAGWTAERLVGRLAHGAGLISEDRPMHPIDLVEGFALARLRRDAVVLA